MCDFSGSGRSRSRDERTSTTSSSTEVPCANGARSPQSHTATSSDTLRFSADEELPWGGPRLIIGTGAHGSLPIMPEVVAEAASRNIDLVAVPTEQACQLIAGLKRREVRAVLHVTC